MFHMPKQSLSRKKEIPERFTAKPFLSGGKESRRKILLAEFSPKRTFPFIGHARFPFRVR